MNAQNRRRLRAGWASVVVGGLVFLGKWAAYVLTDSAAIFSDAAESVVNIVAALMLLGSLLVAARPADDDHPYGHGKVEFLSAAVEGTAILIAAVLIVVEALQQLVSGGAPQQLTLGIVLLVCMSVLNGALGLYLFRTGRRTGSLALQADARHLFADVGTSVGVVAGLLLVQLTGISALDPLAAVVVAVWIAVQGAGVMWQAVDGLMDKADDALLEELASTLERERRAEWIDVHSLRAWRSGAALHTDLHLVVPHYFTATRLHAIHEAVEHCLLAREPEAGRGSDVVIHFDPCGPADCANCEMPACEVRKVASRGRAPITRALATRSDPEAKHAPGVTHAKRSAESAR